jgi:DNA-binding CsgD family transcriptional regulator
MWLVSPTVVAGNLPFRLQTGEFIVGRVKRSQIVIVDGTVSRRHARITCTGGTMTVEDLESSNGTLVNEVLIKKCALQVGDRVRFGGVACVLCTSPLLLRSLGETESTYELPIAKAAHDTILVECFTPAQGAIIPHLMAGRSEAEIATLLCKSRHTIHAHIRKIFERAGVHSREELIVKLVKNG